MSAYPRWASFRVVKIAGAAGWDGCVVGNGRVRKNATSCRRVARREEGKGVIVQSAPGGGVDPEDTSATNLVYIWVSFLAPVSTRRA